MGLTKKIKKYIKLYKQNHEYIDYVCDASGLPRKKVKAQMNDALKMGISYKYFAKKRLWNRTPKQMEVIAQNYKAYRTHNKEVSNDALEHIAEATGLDKAQIKKNAAAAKEICGCTMKDYYKLKMYELTPEQQKTYFTHGVFEKLSFKYNPDAQAVRTLVRKDLFAKKYSDLFHRKWFINRNLSFEKFLELTGDIDALICKPISATQGQGVHKLDLTACRSACKNGYEEDVNELRKLYDTIMAGERAIYEECIIQHPALAAFNESSVNTIRVLTIVDKGVCHHVYAGLRMGCGKLVDNFHAGGIIATVDVKTGITCMDAIDLEGNHYPQHPVSKLDTRGFQLPNWDKVLKITEEAALRLDGAHMVGWDVAITEQGCCLIEGNSEPSHIIIQLPYVDVKEGKRYLVEEFLDD